MNMLLWGTHTTKEQHAPIIEELKKLGFDGVEIPVIQGTEAECSELKTLLHEG
ncbi:MAG: hypothetical protein HYW65_03760 [Candidatus Liptonbacteria bacterium]|nr:hypothetical protein [Candidatus Liptonbacteria bacterium]